MCRNTLQATPMGVCTGGCRDMHVLTCCKQADIVRTTTAAPIAGVKVILKAGVGGGPPASAKPAPLSPGFRAKLDTVKEIMPGPAPASNDGTPRLTTGCQGTGNCRSGPGMIDSCHTRRHRWLFSHHGHAVLGKSNSVPQLSSL